MDRTDQSLLEAVRAGNNHAYAVLYRRYAKFALRLGTSLAGPNDGQDIAADAFTRVLTALVHGRGPLNDLGPYLTKTIRSVAIDRHRREDPVPLAADHPAWQSARSNPESSIDFAYAERDFIRRELERYPDRWRTVLWLVVVEDHPPRELACRLGISPNAVAALVHRIRHRIRHDHNLSATLTHPGLQKESPRTSCTQVGHSVASTRPCRSDIRPESCALTGG